MLAAIAIMGLGLTGMSVYALAWFALIRSRPPTAPNAPIVLKDPTPEEVKKWIPLIEVYEQATIEVRCKSIDTYESSKVLSVSVRPAPADKRKIPWLWESTAVFAVKSKPIGPSKDSFSESYVWKRLFQWLPERGSRECWIELTGMHDGEKRDRTYSGFSEWNEEFRERVAAAWLQEFRDHTPDRWAILSKKVQLAGRFGISENELEEILKATH